MNSTFMETSKFMRRLVIFDLSYLLELKHDTFRSDYDELVFTANLIFDLTRACAERDTTLVGLHND